MASFKPYSSLCDAPTNLKEAIDWVLRVTGKDGKENKDECICGLAAAVTDLLQSVELEYHGYQGDDKVGASADTVKGHLNGLFSLVHGLGGTAVVRTYIDQLAQVLSALVGWSSIQECEKKNGCKSQKDHGTKGGCKYLQEVKRTDRTCETCGCIKGGSTEHLGRGCTKCDGDKCGKADAGGGKCSCKCKDGTSGCTSAAECKCNNKCECTIGTYRSAYRDITISSITGEPTTISRPPNWEDLRSGTNIVGILTGTPSNRRHHCAQILLGSVCLIWSGLTYMYWTGKKPHANTSPYWNNHILDGSGLDDGTLSQWLQALGFPREMLNNHGPGNRMDQVIDNEFMHKFYLGFADTSNSNSNSTVHGKDQYDNTFRNPASLNVAGFIHGINKGAFIEGVFKDNRTDNSVDKNKLGAIFKLYILSCAYFTGLQKKPTPTTPRTPKTIREILYWLSALPYSQAYEGLIGHCKKKVDDIFNNKEDKDKKFSFIFKAGAPPFTVQQVDLYAHFQAVTQYCPLVLIGIQGGIHSSTDSTHSHKEPPIHSLYANTHFSFTYPTVSIQAYNQVVHYIRGLFYQLYFLRKQCAVKVTCGGKWRECRYGDGVVSKGVISWMCLGCNPMEHDRKSRVDELKKTLDGVKGDDAARVKDVLEAIGDVVVQLGNAQEALEGKEKKAILGVKEKLGTAKEALDKVKKDGLKDKLKEADKKLVELTNGSGGALDKLVENGNNAGSLHKVANGGAEHDKDYSAAKDKISAAIHKVRDVLDNLAKGVPQVNGKLNGHQDALLTAIKDLLDIVDTTKCVHCRDHINKCGKESQPTVCKTCHQQYMDGTPSPLQAFLEDRLPGFSCKEVLDQDDPTYPFAADHALHSSASGQCCPLPMGFRGHFMATIGSLNSTGSTLGSGTSTGGSTNERKCPDKGAVQQLTEEGFNLAFDILGIVGEKVAPKTMAHIKGGKDTTPSSPRVVPSLPPTGARLYGILYFFSNGDMMQSCVYRLVRVTSALSATTPQVLGDVFGFFRGGVGNKEEGEQKQRCDHIKDPNDTKNNKDKYFCGWCASGLRQEVQNIQWISKTGNGKDNGYQGSVGTALIDIKGDKGTGNSGYSTATTTTSNLSTLTDGDHYVSPLTGELYTAVSATFGNTYLSWVLYLSDALEGGLKSLASEFQQIECRGCRECDPNKCKKGEHGSTTGDTKSTPLCQCPSIVSCTGVLPVLYRHGFSYGNPFNLEGYHQKDGSKEGDYSITDKGGKKLCHQFLESLNKVLEDKQNTSQKDQEQHPLTNLLSQVGKLQYDIRLPWIFVLTVAWLVAVLYLAFGAIWPLDWTHMRSHWLRGGAHQWQCMWYKVMTGRKGRVVLEGVEYFGKNEVK